MSLEILHSEDLKDPVGLKPTKMLRISLRVLAKSLHGKIVRDDGLRAMFVAIPKMSCKCYCLTHLRVSDLA